MFVLAHLSDPHLVPPPRVHPFEVMGKRALGLANWRLRRVREHRPEVLDALLADLAAQAVDHVAVTGDLVVAALPGEFGPARRFLQAVGPPERTTFVPGNHDAYVAAALRFWGAHWGEYMAGDDDAAGFPFLRRRGAVALVGLSTAVPTGPFMAWGELGAAQLERLAALLAGLGGEAFRVVLLHHPPIAGARERRRGLVDSAAFRAVIRRAGAELVLHGHDHQASLGWIDGPQAPVPVLGVPSASAAATTPHPAAYNLYRIAPAAAGWSCELVVRGLRRGGAGFAELARRPLAPCEF